MASGITDNPMGRAPADCSPSLEYTLNLSDYDALDMLTYDRVLSRKLRFRIRFYASHLFIGAIMAALLGMIVGAYSLDPRTENPSSFLTFLKVICITALSLFTIVLIGLLPKSFFHRITRATNRARFHRARRGQAILGVINPHRLYRVVLTPDWFIETTDFREKGVAVEISEHKQTRVWWSGVARIDMATDHVFFTVSEKGVLIVPRRAFADEASFLAFVDTAKSYREMARLVPAPVADLLTQPDTRIKGRSSV